jgi:hypothetical protein
MQITVTKEQAAEIITANLARITEGTNKTVALVKDGKWEDAQKFVKGIVSLAGVVQKNLEEIGG